MTVSVAIVNTGNWDEDQIAVTVRNKTVTLGRGERVFVSGTDMEHIRLRAWNSLRGEYVGELDVGALDQARPADRWFHKLAAEQEDA